MALSAVLQGVRRIAIDTAPLIYFFERHPVHFVQVEPVIAAIDAAELRGCASTLALLETLVGPIQSGNAALADIYRRALTSAPNLDLIPVDDKVAELAATIRAQHRFKTPDAIHLATAVIGGADAFLTNDAQVVATVADDAWKVVTAVVTTSEPQPDNVLVSPLRARTDSNGRPAASKAAALSS